MNIQIKIDCWMTMKQIETLQYVLFGMGYTWHGGTNYKLWHVSSTGNTPEGFYYILDNVTKKIGWSYKNDMGNPTVVFNINTKMDTIVEFINNPPIPDYVINPKDGVVLIKGISITNSLIKEINDKVNPPADKELHVSFNYPDMLNDTLVPLCRLVKVTICDGTYIKGYEYARGSVCYKAGSVIPLKTYRLNKVTNLIITTYK